MLNPLGSARGVPRASWARSKQRTWGVSYIFVLARTRGAVALAHEFAGVDMVITLLY